MGVSYFRRMASVNLNRKRGISKSRNHGSSELIIERYIERVVITEVLKRHDINLTKKKIKKIKFIYVPVDKSIA